MEHLRETSIPELQQALANVDEKTAAIRLIAAIAYKNGVTQTELADWFDVERKTIYNWLTRLESADLERAVHDDHRTGRPRKLSTNQLKTLERTLHHPPSTAGIDSPVWTVLLVQQFIQDTFDVTYSEPSCRRLMQELGLRHVTKLQAMVELRSVNQRTIEEKIREYGPLWLPQ